jgi:hypothetical protein
MTSPSTRVDDGQRSDRLTVEATLDEMVDDSMRALRANAASRRTYLQSHVFSVAVLIATGLITMRRRLHSPQQWVIATAVLLAIGVALLPVFDALMRWRVRARIRDHINEMLDGRLPMTSAFEVRPDGLWCGSPVGDLTLPWSRATRLVVHDDVEVWFQGNLAVVRARAFTSPARKTAFVDAIAAKLPPGVVVE